jgi:outer membrane protein assembly factor BamE (lipoprotein component of BamABCDE complex)
MKRYLHRMAGLWLLAVLAAGCATDNSNQSNNNQPKDNRPREQRIKVGMTKDEVRQALGSPRGTSTNSQGFESWVYHDGDKGFIPFYAVGGGKFQTLHINFDAEGKVKDWAQDSRGLY